MKKRKNIRIILLYPFLFILILLVGFAIFSYFYLKTYVPSATSDKIETKEDVKHFGQGYIFFTEEEVNIYLYLGFEV
jgi:flagellar basal body-associated protein FliL